MYAPFRVLFLVDARNKLTHEILLGIAKYIKTSQNWMIEKDLSNYLHQLPFTINDIKKMHLDGAVCINLAVDQEALIRKLVKTNLPVLIKGINRDIAGAINIISNNDLIAEMAADHLLNLGLKHFAYLGIKFLMWSKHRKNAFRAKISQAGYDIHIFEFKSTKTSMYDNTDTQRLVEWLTKLPKPAGVMACNDDFGLKILQCCQMADISVPEELAIIGVDNDETVCDLCIPSLSSIARDAQQAGFQGARLLNMQMKGRPVGKKNIFINTTHIETRQSTDMLAIHDANVKEALVFIRKNILHSISVDDVVNEVMISRRNLDQKFTLTLGRTVHEEITRMRIEKTCEMLQMTNLSISQIAYDCGFNNLAQLGGYFARHKGISPGKYRKQYSKISESDHFYFPG